MARQRGVIKLEGTIDDLTFYKTKDGYMAKENPKLSADRIATDPAFVRTRENGAEFGRAGKATTLLHTAFRAQLLSVKDQRMYSRLLKQMMKVIKADTTSIRGMRNVLDGDVELLQGFDFNDNNRLASTLYAPYEATINRATGQFTTSLAAFVPAQMILAPSGATHFRINALAAEIDFVNGSYTADNKATATLPLDNVLTAAISLESTLTPGSTHPLFLAVGIEFLQSVNGEFYQLKNGGYNALGLVKVEGA
ncbi:hypothetical protein OCK74_21005 [Chitinophagaceae bacterium LB-8]|uniref:Uncharacterized protein n=1 Tax=Paraflavisolibacter caeni TaxID=2982496 RepID=A0A9X2XZK4_9BACT|nr:hypothetical protein [Paraflavisolibacter caeni]MCU7551612.1 hypothetical protein [Paraflavisolibacter caeni]